MKAITVYLKALSDKDEKTTTMEQHRQFMRDFGLRR